MMSLESIPYSGIIQTRRLNIKEMAEDCLTRIALLTTSDVFFSICYWPLPSRRGRFLHSKVVRRELPLEPY